MAFRGDRGGSRGRGLPRGGSRGRGRGRGRGAARGRPRGGRSHGHTTKDWTEGEQFGAYKPKEIEEPFLEDDEQRGEDLAGDDTFDLNSAAPLAYSALLTLMKVDTPVDRPRKKKRKIQDVQAEDFEARADLNDDDDEADKELDASEAAAVDVDEDHVIDDPFETHFNPPLTAVLETLCAATKDGKWQQEIIAGGDTERAVLYRAKDETSLSQNQQTINPQNHATWHMKQRLTQSAAKTVSSLPAKLNSRTKLFLSSCFGYQDVSFLTQSRSDTTHLRSVYSLHALNHIFKTRDRILKNNAKLAATPDTEIEYRDQGFTRPKVLIMLPTRNAALEVINEIIALSGAEQVENRKRFNEQFGTEGVDPLKNANKPDDFKALFAGNTDDAFRIGIKFTRKTIKLFSQFYGSDIIVASPLGLRMAIGDVGSKSRDWDYLSSIEVLIVDGANVMAMQNWDHIEYCFEYLNTLPKESHGCDYGRVRNWALEEKSKFLRQTVLISEYEFPELKSLFSTLLNVAGKVRTRCKYSGAIMDIGISVRQTFQKFDSASPGQDPDTRFEFFNSTLLPRLRKLAQIDEAGNGTMLFVPSYFDFVRVRNHLSSLDLSFEAISEYSSTSDLTRSRQLFASGRTPLLVITERLHHYRRYEFKGVRNVFFYQLPEHAKYFTELVRCAVVPGQSSADGEVRIAFSRWDEARLERVVGTKRIGKMLSGKDSTFEFV